MTLTDLINEVYTLTNRQDLVSQTLAAVRSATLKAHKSDFYYKDIYETPISFPTAEYQQQLDYKVVIPRWRSLKYLRKLDVSVTPNVPGKFFDIITPEQVLDSYGTERTDVCYAAGDWIQIKSNTPFQYALVGCYLSPLIGSTDGTYISWIANEQPWAIIYDAASSVCRMIGKTKEAEGFRVLTAEQYQELRMSDILAQGY